MTTWKEHGGNKDRRGNGIGNGGGEGGNDRGYNIDNGKVGDVSSKQKTIPETANPG